MAPAHKGAARERVRAHLLSLAERPVSQLWVRINPLETPAAALDLAAVIRARPDGIVQPKVRGPEDVLQLAQLLLSHRRWRVGHQINRLGRLGERDHLAKIGRAGQQHHYAIEPQRNAAVWRRAVLQRIEEESEALARLFF